MLAQNLARVRERIAQACQRCGRDPASVTLICVTKGIPADTMAELIRLGARDLGENRVQEAREKQTVLGSRLKVQGNLEPRTLNLEPIRWHLIGHLQRNKARDAVALFSMIHSVDSAALAEELQRQAVKRVQGSRFKARGPLEPPTFNLEPLEVFVQVNVSGEATKFGCAPDDAPALAGAVMMLPHLRLVGLMTMAPFVNDPEETRSYFRRLRELRDSLHHQLGSGPLGHSATRPLKLSMGMSNDFDVAIEEGADFVRVGTAIFKGHGAGDVGQGKG